MAENTTENTKPKAPDYPANADIIDFDNRNCVIEWNDFKGTRYVRVREVTAVTVRGEVAGYMIKWDKGLNVTLSPAGWAILSHNVKEFIAGKQQKLLEKPIATAPLSEGGGKK